MNTESKSKIQFCFTAHVVLKPVKEKLFPEIKILVTAKL